MEMTDVQKELLEMQARREKAALRRLKQTYRTALEDVKEKIAILERNPDMQSKVYQLEFQNSLKSQLTGILSKLEQEEYSNINEYLHNCYEDGFIGSLYDMQKQGVPLLFPINQDEVVRALETNSKISEGLYKRLGINTVELKNAIAEEVTRGFQSDLSYDLIGRNITNRMQTGYSRAVRIARTEGHRIISESTFDAQRKAKDNGADVVKQWDSTNDRRTRTSHVELDGQIRELEEPFEINGHAAMYPGGFGVASEDINCRCAILQRARWNLSEEETQELSDHAGDVIVNEISDAGNYGDFKSRYEDIIAERRKYDKLKAVQAENSVYGILQYPPIKVDVSDFLFDADHVARHGVTEEEARMFIRNADFTLVRLYHDEVFVNFYGKSGAAYVNMSKKVIRTAYSEKDFRGGPRIMVEALYEG